MFTVIGLMLAGMVIGYISRSHRAIWIQKVITILIWVLLLILGIEVGGNQRIIEGFATLGAEAILISLTCTLGSVLAAWLLWKIVYRQAKQK